MENISPTTDTGPLAKFAALVRIGELMRTAAVLVIGLAGAAAIAYQHFAKTAELGQLRCSVLDQNDMNNALYQASNDIGTALKLLKTSLNQSPPSIQTTASLAQELSITITSVENSLKKVSEIRSKLQADSIKVDRKC